MLTLIEKFPNGKGLFKCDCGGTTIARRDDVKRGKHNSCSCRRYNIKHGLSGDSLYTIWRGMMRRCYDTKERSYSRYGGRGIIVCDRWRENFANFKNDIGDRPSEEHSLERINNDGDYEPDNVKWATSSEQANNRSTNVVIEYLGESKTLTQWSRELNISTKQIKKLGITEAVKCKEKKKLPKKERLKYRKPLIGCAWLLTETSNSREYSYYCNEEPCSKCKDLCNEHYDKANELDMLKYFECNNKI